MFHAHQPRSQWRTHVASINRLPPRMWFGLRNSNPLASPLEINWEACLPLLPCCAGRGICACRVFHQLEENITNVASQNKSTFLPSREEFRWWRRSTEERVAIRFLCLDSRMRVCRYIRVCMSVWVGGVVQWVGDALVWTWNFIVEFNSARDCLCCMLVVSGYKVIILWILYLCSSHPEVNCSLTTRTQGR